jgi:hypothetical protein
VQAVRYAELSQSRRNAMFFLRGGSAKHKYCVFSTLREEREKGDEANPFEQTIIAQRCNLTNGDEDHLLQIQPPCLHWGDICGPLDHDICLEGRYGMFFIVTYISSFCFHI